MRELEEYAALLESFCSAVIRGEAGVVPYTNNYLASHEQAVREVFPGVLDALGPTIFAALPA